MKQKSFLDHIKEFEDNQAPPVETWHPEHCGDIDISIDVQGRWFHMGDEIKRASLVRLFSRILRREEDGSFVLVTPVEKMRIKVEDAPFLAISMEEVTIKEKKGYLFTTNLGDKVMAGQNHPIWCENNERGHVKPYVEIRKGLPALITRPVYYEMVEKTVEKGKQVYLESFDECFLIGSL